MLNNKFNKEKVGTIHITKNIKRKLEEKIWEIQLIKKYFYKVSEKHVETIKKYKNVKMKLVEEIKRQKTLLKY